jgi:hypothetical protein
LSFSFDSEPEPVKRGRTDPAEPIVEIHDATDQPMPPASTSTQIQPLSHNSDLRQTTVCESNVTVQQLDQIPKLSAPPAPGRMNVNSSGSQTVSAIYSPDTMRPQLVRRLPPRDPSIQCSIPSMELIDMEPRPQNPNLVRRVKRAPTFEFVNTASTSSTIQPPTITIHSPTTAVQPPTIAIQPPTIAIQLSDMETQVDETQSLAVAAAAEVNETHSLPAAAEVDETQSLVAAADVEQNGRQHPFAIANPLFVNSRCRKLQ